MSELTVLIPARNEEWLARTIQEVLLQMRADTEVVAVLDGEWADPPIEDHPRVHLVYHPKSVGQRAATNEAARIARSPYVMKLDAHCALAPGFDRALLDAAQVLGDDVTQIPEMRNLHVFDWVCETCGRRIYQGPHPSTFDEAKAKRERLCACRPIRMRREVVWRPRRGTHNFFYRIDGDLRFQYWGAFGARPEAAGDYPETMCQIGACWFVNRQRFLDLGGLDEAHGSWGQMGVEMSCKAWLSGGRQVTNRKTWFAHLFRTQPGFGFPYPMSGKDQDHARAHSRKLWLEGGWPGAVRPFSWLVEHFAPVPDWSDRGTPAPVVRHGGMSAAAVASEPAPATGPEVEEPILTTPSPAPAIVAPGPRKGIVYYTDLRPNGEMLETVRRQIGRAAPGIARVCVSLKQSVPWEFTTGIVVNRERGILTMFKQILAGLEAIDADVVFLCEHDVLYHPSHFDFVPPRKDAYYYNVNTWKVDAATGRAVTYVTKQTSGLCAWRDLLVGHYRRRVAKVEQNAKDLAAAGLPVKRDGFSQHMGFEPGCHMVPRGVDNYPALAWTSASPNVDIRHDRNLTPNRWDPSLFRDPRSCQGWTEADEVPGWGRTKGRFREFLAEAVPLL